MTRVRTRFNTETGHQGTTPYIRPVFNQRTEDASPGWGKNNFFHTEKKELTGSLVNGRVRSNRFYNKPSNLNLDWATGLWLVLPESEDNAYLRMIAGTAPRRQAFLGPAFLAELRDVPRLIEYGGGAALWLRQAFKGRLRPGQVGSMTDDISPEWVVSQFKPTVGNALSKAQKLAQANLALKFGVAPYISDLSTAIGFTDAFNKRRKELDNLQERGVSPRRWQLGEGAQTWPPESGLLHSLGSVYATFNYTVEAKRWATVRYYPLLNHMPPNLSDQELRMSMLGLDPRGVLLSTWEVLPWTWLTDYFLNIGDYLAATANTIGYQASGCVMQTTTVRITHEAAHNIESLVDVHVSAGMVTRVTKTRRTMYDIPLPTLNGDFFSPNQLSVLSSIAAIKGLRP